MPQLMYVESPLGRLALVEEAGKLAEVAFGPEKLLAGDYQETATPLLQETAKQLGEYFAGQRRDFELPLGPKGTAFQQACWQALCEIPYGQVCSYGDIARKIGRPQAVRAVGQANHHNPIAIIIPCHRVIGSNGKLTGYGGGLDKKELLLQLEQQG